MWQLSKWFYCNYFWGKSEKKHMIGTIGLIKWIFQIHPFRNFVESYDSILGYSFTAPKLSVYLISFFETLINWSSFTQLGKTHLRSRIHRRKNEILWFSSVETSRLRGKKITRFLVLKFFPNKYYNWMKSLNYKKTSFPLLLFCNSIIWMKVIFAVMCTT